MIVLYKTVTNFHNFNRKQNQTKPNQKKKDPKQQQQKNQSH